MDSDTISGGVLFVLAIAAFLNYRNGHLGDWAKAKFLNSAEPKPESSKDATKTVFGGGTTSPGQTGLGGGLSGLLMPVQGAISSVFGDSRPGGRSHKGLDIAATTGTPIAAAGNGRVTFAGNSGLYGNRVDIDQGNGVVTRYGHLSTIGVHVGDVVNVGQSIGKVGATGDASGPHLHFEVLSNGVNIDPAAALGLNRGRVA